MAVASDLAELLQAELERLKRPSPGLGTLTELVELAFFATLKRDEAEAIKLELVYLDPDDPDPFPPPKVRRPRWRFYRFESIIPATVGSVVKLAKAIDGRTSSLAVYQADAGGLEIVGLIDEGLGHGRQRNYEGGYLLPGAFRLVALDVARVAAHVDLQLVGELNGRDLLPKPVDVFSSGPVFDRLVDGALSRLQATSQHSGTAGEGVAGTESDAVSISSSWITAVRRLLLRVQGHRHGGAVLLTSGQPSGEALNIKYKVDYDRLGDALVAHHQRAGTKRATIESALTEGGDAWRNYSIAKTDLSDSEEELDGVLWFLSLLTRVDGLVSMDVTLRTYGFGAEILEGATPQRVLIAQDPSGLDTVVGEYERWGTRHRSMMRYCAANPDSLGFVVSQDGDVRAMTGIGEELVVWDGVQLQVDRPAIGAEERQQRALRQAVLRKRRAAEPSESG